MALNKLCAFIGKIPLNLRIRLGRLLGTIVSFFPSRERTIADLQIQSVLGPESRKNLKKIYANLGQTVLECTNLSPILASVDFPGLQVFKTAVENEAGCLALSAHLGNWELLAAKVAASGINLTVIGRESRESTFQALIDNLRNSYGVKTLWRTERKGSNRELVRAFQKGKAIAALIDQDTTVSSIHVPFFGIPCKTPSSIIDLALRKGSSIIAIFIARTSNTHSRIFIKRLPITATTSTFEILSSYNQQLEALIREYPDQWVWFHKRWRTKENGITLSSREYTAQLYSDCKRQAL
jgi:KDO2-lipid IV(A) lauroyltransferase